jgi:hypothetical protein
VVVSLLLAACAATSPPPQTPVPAGPPPLHLAPATDLAQAASITWLVDLSPRALTSHAELLPAIELIFPRARVAAFAERNGFDPFALEELTAATYSSSAAGDTTLYLARGDLPAEKLNAAFRRLAGELEGSAIDRQGAQEITRAWGTLLGTRAQLATFGHELVALEVGRFGPLRAAELFAEQKLKRASPALKSGTLRRAADLVGDAPIRAFALGPFEGESAKALLGLAGASTGGAIAAQPDVIEGHAALQVTLVLTGGWGPDAPDAATRLSKAFDALSATPFGRLAGLDRPLDPVRVEPFPDALRLTVALDPLTLARGLRASSGAEISEIMSY